MQVIHHVLVELSVPIQIFKFVALLPSYFLLLLGVSGLRPGVYRLLRCVNDHVGAICIGVDFLNGISHKPCVLIIHNVSSQRKLGHILLEFK